jgi:hypothetical protein
MRASVQWSADALGRSTVFLLHGPTRLGTPFANDNVSEHLLELDRDSIPDVVF